MKRFRYPTRSRPGTFDKNRLASFSALLWFSSVATSFVCASRDALLGSNLIKTQRRWIQFWKKASSHEVKAKISQILTTWEWIEPFTWLTVPCLRFTPSSLRATGSSDTSKNVSRGCSSTCLPPCSSWVSWVSLLGAVQYFRIICKRHLDCPCSLDKPLKCSKKLGDVLFNTKFDRQCEPPPPRRELFRQLPDLLLPRQTL